MAVWKEVELKGVTWLVCDDDQVMRPAHKCTFTRKQRGITYVTTNTRPESLCHPKKDPKTGRLYVVVHRSRERTQAAVHELVAAAFLPPRPEGARMRWIDGNEHNNRADNLQWWVRPVRKVWPRKAWVPDPADYAGVKVEFADHVPQEARDAVIRSIARTMKSAQGTSYPLTTTCTVQRSAPPLSPSKDAVPDEAPPNSVA